MILKYNFNIESHVIAQKFQNLINQIYKLLPVREQNGDWQKPLQTILEELSGIQNLLQCGDSEVFLTLINKLEGLHSLKDNSLFFCYRRIIFECLNLMNVLKKELCLQTY